jgi:Glycosyltransferase family 87
MWLVSKAASVLVGLALLVCLLVIATDRRHYEWDFRIFHNAPTALDTGDNPYDGTNPRLHYPDELPYLYPPITLYAFDPLSKFSERTARAAWLAAKLLALAALLLLWHRHFEALNVSVPLVLFLALWYNASLLRDFAAGNIAVFEQLGIWLGFYFLVQNRPYVAGLILAATAQFKLVPVVFLGTLLFVGPPARWKPFATSVAAFGGLFSLNYLLTPHLMTQYLAALSGGSPNMDERGEADPSALALIRDVTEAAASWGLPVGHSAANVTYVVYVAVCAFVLLWFVRKNATTLINRDPRWMIYCACVVYVLTMPRVKDYSYIVLLLPSLFLIRQINMGRIQAAWSVPALAVLMFMPGRQSYVPGLQTLLPWVQSYLPWLIGWGLLYYLVRTPVEARVPSTIALPRPETSNGLALPVRTGDLPIT